MKKLFSLLAALAAFACFFAAGTPRAEAARLAIIPLEQSAEILNGVKKEGKDARDFSILYWDVANEVFTFPGFEIVGDAAVDRALPDGALKKYDEAELQRIATECEADVVVAMRVDSLTSKSLYRYKEPITNIKLTGEYASLNRVTGKYLHEDINYKDKVETPLLRRGDWRVDLMTKIFRTYMTRTRDQE